MSRLLSETYLNSLPDTIAKNMESLNRYVVERICKRIKEIGKVSASDAHRLKTAIEYAGADIAAIQKEMERITGLNTKALEAVFDDVAAENISFANAYYKARGMKLLNGYTENAALRSFVDAAKKTAADVVTNLSNTTMIGFRVKTQSGSVIVPLREFYIQTIDKAITFVQTGTVDYYTAMRQTIKELARSGVRQYKGYKATFPTGYSRRIDSQVRLNLLEGVRQLNMAMLEQAGKEFGADGVEISAHALCAPDHQSIQGRQFSNAEFERINRGLERPIGKLNCHHFTTPIILGVSKPVYSSSELREINKRSNAKVEYGGKKYTRYEASQRQRQLETAIRYAKDERDACVSAGDKLGATQARRKSAALTAEYKRFSEAVGLTKRMERTR